MLLQIATLVENLVTLSTCKWLFSCVCPSILFQRSDSWNALSNLEQGNGLLDPNFYKTFTSIESLPCFRVNSSLLILGPFPAFTPKLHCHWMPCHTWNREMASLLCEFCHASSKLHCHWMPCHSWKRLRASPLFLNNCSLLFNFTFEGRGSSKKCPNMI